MPLVWSLNYSTCQIFKSAFDGLHAAVAILSNFGSRSFIVGEPLESHDDDKQPLPSDDMAWLCMQEEQVLVLPSLQLEAPMESYEDLAPGRTYAFSPFPATPAVAAASPDRHSEAQVQSQTFYKRLLLDVLA